MHIKILVLAACLTASNFIFEAITSQEWHTAIERSYFQAVALLIFVLIN